MRRLLARYFRRRRPVDWEILVTTPYGKLLSIDTEELYAAWKYGTRSNDGYLEIARLPAVHIWIKPRGWQEPESRLAALDGTGTLTR